MYPSENFFPAALKKSGDMHRILPGPDPERKEGAG